ncbi:MAG: stage II sporulation protein M [Bacteroidetes bacterium]|nr:stage II sporulation protein M [Bacteroidota bacterium]
MREALFIKKNKDRWLRIQQDPSTDPDEVAADFIQLVDDLAYAKTFYPSGHVTKFINAQAARIYLDVYSNRKEESNRLIRFWKYDLPLTIRKHHRVILFSFLLFTIFFIIGFFTASQDEGVTREFLGDWYVKHTRDNIKSGNPFGIYEHGNGFLSWLGIMVNNITVSLRMFAVGIVFGLPSMYELAQTGVMLGVFDQMFAANGLGLDFWLVVFVHGTLEITAIILAGAAGIVLGKSYLFPGTIKRVDALKQGAKDGVKIIIGLLPVFALAAFFEGLFTRLYNDIPALTTAITVSSAVFVIWYFIIYPIRLGKRLSLPQIEEA